jgi:ABC-2 type transport system ATP-binding protein
MPNLFGKKMIEISNLTKHSGNTTIISDVSFSAHQQECLGLFGQDHSAKTVLLDLIAGSTQPSSGHINIQNVNTHTDALKARQLVGYQLSKDIGHPTMSVKVFLDFIATVRGYYGAEKRARLEQVIARLELFPVLGIPLDALCIGWKRKVAIAQAVLHGPALLLLDEPTEGLAPEHKHALMALIHSLAQEMTVIIASRHCEELAQLCSRALVMAGGRLVADTSLPNLQRDSRHFQAVTLAADTPLDLLALAVLPGVAGIEEHRHAPGTVTVLAMPGHTIYPHINTLIASRRWKINSMNLEPGRLNDVVHHLSKEASL